MKKRTFLYIPLVLLFAFAISALAAHFYNIYEITGREAREAELPFAYVSGEVLSVSAESTPNGLAGGQKLPRNRAEGKASAEDKRIKD